MPNIKTIHLVIAVIVIGSIFTWTSVRPYLDRKHCNDYAAAQVESAGSPNDTKVFDLYMRHYTVCANSHGLSD
jgi:hypothetical protein